MPFHARDIQVDGGSELQEAFAASCQNGRIHLLLLPPRSTRLNGHVERARRTHPKELYELTDSNFDMVEMNDALRKWELVYDTVRPHQSLGYLTPHQFLQKYHHNRNEIMCHQSIG
ncbi:MAG: integrase core domain-containing protein [Dehalococcoidia bacterium]|nr:integrase core domain-containing protein [Dehalococcoidia bacterium]